MQLSELSDRSTGGFKICPSIWVRLRGETNTTLYAPTLQPPMHGPNADHNQVNRTTVLHGDESETLLGRCAADVQKLDFLLLHVRPSSGRLRLQFAPREAVRYGFCMSKA